MKKIQITYIFLFLALAINAQDYKEDLKKMTELYQSMDKYATEVHVSTYETATSKQPSYYQKTVIKKDGNKFFYQFNSNIMMVNNKYSVMVDLRQKNIVYKPLKKGANLDMKELTSMTELEKVTEAYKKVEYKGIKNGVKHYVIYPKYSLEKAEFFMKPNGLLTKIIYEYKNNQQGVKRMVATFENSTLTPAFSKNQFSEKQFFTPQGRKQVATPKYKNFNLIKVSDHEG